MFHYFIILHELWNFNKKSSFFVRKLFLYSLTVYLSVIGLIRI